MLCRNETWAVTGTYILATMSKYAHFNVKKAIGTTTRGYEVRYMLKINHECPGKSIFRQAPIPMNAKHTGNSRAVPNAATGSCLWELSGGDPWKNLVFPLCVCFLRPPMQ